MEKLPDKILLIHSELPLAFAESIDNSDTDFLFRQIISPFQTTKNICLLCKPSDSHFGNKYEENIFIHYKALHNLEVHTGHAKFSDDIVFIYLPKVLLSQIDFPSGPRILNLACQCCESSLSDINALRSHYANEHNKHVHFLEHEAILEMHHSFYCSKCIFKSADLESHHKHMKMEHSQKTILSRTDEVCCSFANDPFTEEEDPSDLRNSDGWQDGRNQGFFANF